MICTGNQSLLAEEEGQKQKGWAGVGLCWWEGEEEAAGTVLGLSVPVG